MIDDGQRAAFAAWAATEGITKVGFSPVKALGRTVGNVWGERDHHLVLLDREWGIWQASQASRPREAGSGAMEDKLRDARAANERDRTIVARSLSAVRAVVSGYSWAPEGRGSYDWDDDEYRKEFGLALAAVSEAVEPLQRVAGDMSNCPLKDEDVRAAKAMIAAPPVAPEACPVRVVVAGPAVRAMDAILDKMRDTDTPASATAEAKCGTCGGTGPDRPHIQTRTFSGKCPDAFHGSFPATPATPVCPRCRGGGLVILADLPIEGLICGGRCPCGASLGTPKDKPS